MASPLASKQMSTRVENVAIDPQWQGQSIGKAMMQPTPALPDLPNPSSREEAAIFTLEHRRIGTHGLCIDLPNNKSAGQAALLFGTIADQPNFRRAAKPISPKPASSMA